MSFTARFVAVLLLVGGAMAAIPIITTRAEARDLAIAEAHQQATLAAQLFTSQTAALTAYATAIAHQLDPLSETDRQSALLADSRAAAAGDVIAVSGPSPIAVRDGATLGAADPAVTTVGGAPVASIITAGSTLWMVGHAAMPDGSSVAVARPLTTASFPAIAVLHNGDVVGTTSGLDGGAIAALRGSAGVLAGNASHDGVSDTPGPQQGVAAAALGNGYWFAAAAPVGGGAVVDPTLILVIALAAVGLLLVVVVVQADLNLPLRRLDRAVAAVGDGHFDEPLPRVGGQDAIARVATTFEAMRRRIDLSLRTSRGRAMCADELTTAQPLRRALQNVCAIVRETTGAVHVAITIDESEIGESFAAEAGEPADGTTTTTVELRTGHTHCGHLSVAGTTRHDGTDAGDAAAVYDEFLRTIAEQIGHAVERYRMLAMMETRASTDDLTGLRNHRFLMDHLNQQLAIAERQGTPLSVLMLDIDHFKRINDTHGHATGDRALQSFATTVAESVRRADLCARYGGEEFVVVMPDTTAEDAAAVAEKIRAQVAAIEVDLGASAPPLTFTVSIGVAEYPYNTLNGPELIRLADEALYDAKDGGRNRVVTSDRRSLAGSVHGGA